MRKTCLMLHANNKDADQTAPSHTSEDRFSHDVAHKILEMALWSINTYKKLITFFKLCSGGRYWSLIVALPGILFH